MLTVPLLKVGQSLTKEVERGEVERGEFFDSLTGDGLGNKIEFIIAYYQKGRFATDNKNDRTYVAFSDVIPEGWEPYVGAEFVGTHFSEHPDAEEVYKERANSGAIDWGKGPPISTTYNFTGLVVVPPLEGEEEEGDQLRPARLSLKRSDTPAAKKIHSLRAAAGRGKPFWENVFDLSTYYQDFNVGSAYLLSVRRGRKTTPAEKQVAVELAQHVMYGLTTDNQAEQAAEKPAEPAAQGGLDL